MTNSHLALIVTLLGSAGASLTSGTAPSTKPVASVHDRAIEDLYRIYGLQETHRVLYGRYASHLTPGPSDSLHLSMGKTTPYSLDHTGSLRYRIRVRQAGLRHSCSMQVDRVHLGVLPRIQCPR